MGICITEGILKQDFTVLIKLDVFSDFCIWMGLYYKQELRELILGSYFCYYYDEHLTFQGVKGLAIKDINSRVSEFNNLEKIEKCIY